MSGSVNKAILLGHLGRDPEVRHAQDETKIVHLTIATSERWRDKTTGELREKTEWHRVVIFNEHLADVAEKYLAKDRQVYVEGQLQTGKWTDQSGQERYSTEIVLQRFRGELILIGNRDDTAGGEGDRDASRANHDNEVIPFEPVNPDVRRPDPRGSRCPSPRLPNPCQQAANLTKPSTDLGPESKVNFGHSRCGYLRGNVN